MDRESYSAGYKAARADMRRDLGAILRVHVLGTGEPDDRPLTSSQAREIFAGVFGPDEAAEEFGEDPRETALLDAWDDLDGLTLDGPI